MDFDDRLKHLWGRVKARFDKDGDGRNDLLEHIRESVEDLRDEKRARSAAALARALRVIHPELKHVEDLPEDSLELPTRVEGNGSLLGTGKWELLDIGWLTSLAHWLDSLDEIAPFRDTPKALIEIPDEVELTLAGDWGTGFWRKDPISPAEAVAQAMTAEGQPEITIHLGDVYYAGTEDEERENLVDVWPSGSRGTYTLNSNHEMYDGANSYYRALDEHFTDQGGCSFFALQNSQWLIVGLDSAYHSDRWELYMKGNIEDAQRAWLRSLPPRQGIILLSHHAGYDLTGDRQTELYSQVLDCLTDSAGNSRYQQVYWYWGHLHNAVVYGARGIRGGTVHGRCIGHAAIPYGDASDLVGAPGVLWYERENARDPDIPERVLAGFARVKLSGSELEERLIGEQGQPRWPLKDAPAG